MEPTRIEVDMPIVVFNRYGNLEMPNHRPVADVLQNMFGPGSVISLHLIVESIETDKRGFCKFEDPNSSYKSECGYTFEADGTCIRQDVHDAALAKWAAGAADRAEEETE